MRIRPRSAQPAHTRHPAYSDGQAAFVRNWMNGGFPSVPWWSSLMIPFPRNLINAYLSDQTHLEPTDVTLVFALRQELACGPAPFVGEPFHYSWKVAVDELGRQVAGDQVSRTPQWAHAPWCGGQSI